MSSNANTTELEVKLKIENDIMHWKERVEYAAYHGKIGGLLKPRSGVCIRIIKGSCDIFDIYLQATWQCNSFFPGIMKNAETVFLCKA